MIPRASVIVNPDPEVVEGDVIETTVRANEAFNSRLDAKARDAETLRVLRQTRNAARLMVVLVVFLIVALLSGCSDERTWATAEKLRQQIDQELTAARIVPPEQLDAMRTIVYGRPRSPSETPSRGIAEATARIDQERIALAAAEAKFRSSVRTVTNPAAAATLPPELVAWQAKVRRARRILLVAELAPSMPDVGPVLDQLVSEELAHTPSKVVPRTLPPSESLRLERARKAFGDFLRAFEEVQP